MLFTQTVQEAASKVISAVITVLLFVLRRVNPSVPKEIMLRRLKASVPITRREPDNKRTDGFTRRKKYSL